MTSLYAICALSLLQITADAQERGIEVEGAEDGPNQTGYGRRHALVIGIDEYEDAGFQDLAYAVADAKAVANSLMDRYGFEQEYVKLLLNEHATRDAVSEALEEWAADSDRVGHEDLFVLFFAGHGETRRLGERGDRGYLVPVDGHPGKWSSLLGMDDLADASDAIPAKHALFILDSCFSGLVVNRSAAPIAAGLTNRARQVLTAGNAEQRVEDGGGKGHSVFTRAVLDALSGDADLDTDGVVTYGELANHVAAVVEARTEQRQTPLRAEFPDHEGGSVALFPPGVRPAALSNRELLSAARADASWAHYLVSIQAAATHLEEGNTLAARERLDECPTDARGWEWNYLWAKSHPEDAFVELDGQVRAVSAGTGNRPFRCVYEIQGADGQELVLCEVGESGQERIHSGVSGQNVIGLTSGLRPLALISNYRDEVSLVSLDGTVEAVSLNDGERILTMERSTKVAFEPGGALVATATGDRLDVWNVEDGSLVATRFEEGIREMLFTSRHLVWIRSPDNGRNPPGIDVEPHMILESWNIEDLEDSTHAVRIDGIHRVYSMSLDAAGERAALGLKSGVKVVSLAAGASLGEYDGHASRRGNHVHSIAFGPRGLMSSSDAYETHLWRIGTRERGIALNEDYRMRVAFDSDGEFLSTFSRNSVRLWHVDSLDEHKDPFFVGLGRREAVPSFNLLFDSTGRTLHEACWDGVATYDLLSGIVRRYALYPSGISIPVTRITDDGRVWISSPEGQWTWDPVGNRWAPEPEVVTQSGLPGTRPVLRLLEVRSTAGDVAHVWLPSSESIVIEPGTGGPSQICSGHKLLVSCAAFSPDNTRLASGSDDTTVRIWRVSTGELLVTLREHEAMIMEVAFSPNGRWLVSVDVDGHLVIRDTMSKSEARYVARHAIAGMNRLVELLDEEGTAMGALARLDLDENLSAEELREAQELARGLGDSAESLNRRAWNRAITRSMPVARYRGALLAADRACELDPENPSFLTTVGALQYRLGLNEEGISSLTWALELTQHPGMLDIRARALAVLAMCHHALGDEPAARESLLEAHHQMTDPTTEARVLLTEADRLVGSESPR